MRFEIGDYVIQSDQRSLQLLRRQEIKESRMTKAENVGKIREVCLGYPANLQQAVNMLLRQQLLDDQDVQTADALIDLLIAQNELVHQVADAAGKEIRRLEQELRATVGASSTTSEDDNQEESPCDI